MTAEHPVNEILAIRRYHTIPYRHSVMQFFQVVWHTGKVLACDTVDPRFNTRQGQGIL